MLQWWLGISSAVVAGLVMLAVRWLVEERRRTDKLLVLVKWQAVALVLLSKKVQVDLPELPEHVLYL